jgi:hypothetical protein
VSFRPTRAFLSLAEASRFLEECERSEAGGGSGGGELALVRLAPTPWRVEPVRVIAAHARLFEDGVLFPRGAAELDGAIALRALPLEWARVRSAAERRQEPPLPQPA